MKAIFIYLGIALLAIAGLSACAKNTYSTNTNSSNNGFANTTNISNGNSMNSMSNSTTTTNMDKGSTSDDSDFMNEAAVGGMAEVDLGKLAASKASNAEVKKFGQLMVEDH